MSPLPSPHPTPLPPRLPEPQGMKLLASPLFIWLALSFSVIASSRHYLVETEDGAAEYPGKKDNGKLFPKGLPPPDVEYQNGYYGDYQKPRFLDYGLKPRLWGKKEKLRMK